MSLRCTERRVVGVDVGGPRKGFHAVALDSGAYFDRLQTCNVHELVNWLRVDVRAQIVAIDAPCRWSTGEGGRAAERELLRQGIRCFLTPTRGDATSHPKGYYDWMLRGAALFRALERTHPLSRAAPSTGGKCCLETFPHAITWSLRGGNADAARKRPQRMALLRQHGCRANELTNMDWIDAALCALAADILATGGGMQVYGDWRTGHIVVPVRHDKPDLVAGAKRRG